ncbi:MAG: hypothetical protein U0441_11665 [Polyangiaceae bacterium]
MSSDEEKDPEDAKATPEDAKAEESEAPSRKERQATARRDKRSPTRRRTGARRVAAAETPEDVVLAKPLGGAVRLAEEKAARRFLGVGVTLAAAGLALVGTGPNEVGMAITLAGLLTLIYGIHTFGRLGPVPAK